jgi:hypothetical protein
MIDLEIKWQITLKLRRQNRNIVAETQKKYVKYFALLNIKKVCSSRWDWRLNFHMGYFIGL